MGRSPGVQKFVGRSIGRYIKLVMRTSRFDYDPEDYYACLDESRPAILTMWHGQQLLAPSFIRPTDDMRGLVSRHRDGGIQAYIVEYFGGRLVRGSGHIGQGAGQARDIARKGGVGAMMGMLRALEEGATIFQTADVPKRARHAGLGIVTLARNSQRPILPIAFASKRRVQLNSWDKATIHLPFNRGTAVIGEPITVPEGTLRTDMEPYRQRIEDGLNNVQARAEEMLREIDGKRR